MCCNISSRCHPSCHPSRHPSRLLRPRTHPVTLLLSIAGQNKTTVQAGCGWMWRHETAGWIRRRPSSILSRRFSLASHTCLHTAYTHVYAHVAIHVNTNGYTHVHPFFYTHIHTHTCLFIWRHTCPHRCLHTCPYTYPYAVYMSMHKSACMHTHNTHLLPVFEMLDKDDDGSFSCAEWNDFVTARM